jgi:hypothetical protein
MTPSRMRSFVVVPPWNSRFDQVVEAAQVSERLVHVDLKFDPIGDMRVLVVKCNPSICRPLIETAMLRVFQSQRSR